MTSISASGTSLAVPELEALSPMEPRRSAADIAYEKLRAAVIGLALPPGSPIARSAIAGRLGISQTPLREALIRLQAEGLVEVVPHSATRVSRIDLAAAREAHVLRLAVELEVVRRLAAAPPATLGAALAAANSGMAAALEAADQAAFAEADDSFHTTLHEAAGVPGLRDLVKSRSGHLDRLRRLHLPAPGKAEAVLREHEVLTLAILAGDAPAAEAALRAHLSGTFAEAGQLRSVRPEYFVPD